jgi:hypothetical protein
MLVANGYALVCVSAIEQRYASSRETNLRQLGFPIERVIATLGECIHGSPKAGAIAELWPVAFVDDYLPYLAGIPPTVHAALIMREPDGSPNCGPEMRHVHSPHADLASFAQWWLQR